MTRCPYCGTSLASEYFRVTVASDAELRDPVYLTRLKEAAAALNLPRRQWRDAIADTLCGFEGELRHPDGRTYPFPFVDDHFPEDEDQKWVSGFLRAPVLGQRIKLQGRVLERVRLIDLLFRLKYPEVAIKFGRFAAANDNSFSRG